MTWITPQDAAKLCSCDASTIRRKANRGAFGEEGVRYINGSTGRGGKRLEILLEALPPEAQTAYHNQHGEASKPIINREQFTLSQREKGERRAQAVSQYSKYRREQHRAGQTKETEIMQSFVEQWNALHPDFTFTTKTLYEWRRKSKAGDPEKLVDKRGGYNRGKSSIPEEMLTYFKHLYLQESKPSVANCFRLTQYEANRRGVVIPGIRAFELAAANIPAPIVALYREGGKYFSDRYMPYSERDYEELAPNDRWVSDHHLWDVFVRVPDSNGGWRAIRPWGTYWMDMRTRKVVASIVRNDSPNADVVVCSFGIGVETYGVPRSVLLDNGRDYKAKDVFNKQCEEVIDSLANNLQIDTIYAIPYNAKAKPIERTFDTFEQQFGKLQPTYAGSNAKARPESLHDLDILEYPTLDEFTSMHDQYVYEIYNESPHSGSYMHGKSPNQMYATLPFAVRRVTKKVLYFSLMRVKGSRVVQRNGITFNGVHFYNDCVINYIGKTVYARYSPKEPDILYIFDENQNYLFSASRIQKMTFHLTAENYEYENGRRKRARHEALDGYKPNKGIRTVQGVQELVAGAAAAHQKAPKAAPNVTEIIRNPQLEETARRADTTDAERQYRDAVEKQLAAKQVKDSQKKRYADVFKQICAERSQQSRKAANG